MDVVVKTHLVHRSGEKFATMQPVQKVGEEKLAMEKSAPLSGRRSMGVSEVDLSRNITTPHWQVATQTLGPAVALVRLLRRLVIRILAGWRAWHGVTSPRPPYRRRVGSGSGDLCHYCCSCVVSL
jgi:hypothetical protein